MNCGEKIAKLRKSNNMTQAELGDTLSVTYQAVSKWERGESQPDFDTISRISKLFQVPISYFEDESDVQSEAAATAAASSGIGDDILGMCTQCGKVVRDGEAETTEPKLICKSCAEHNRNEEKARVAAAQKAKADAEQRQRDNIRYEKSALKRKRNHALIFSAIPALVIFVIFLVLSLQPDNKPLFGFIFGIGIVLTACAYTFTAQMIWDGTVREVCTAGGHIMSMPGVIFSLSPDGLLFLILTKIFLAIVAAIVFVGSIIACFLAAVIISPITFVPSLLLYNRKIHNVG